MIGELGNLKPFCSCLGWWCRAQQSQKVQERLQVKLPELTLAMGWRRRWQPTTSLWMWLFHRLRYNNGAADERSATSVPSLSIFVIQILLSPTLVLLTKILLGHHPLRDFIRNRWNSASPSSVLESAGPWFPRPSLSELQSLCEHPLLHLLYVLGGVGNEDGRALQDTSVGEGNIHYFENDPSLERSRRCSHKQVSISLTHRRP